MFLLTHPFVVDFSSGVMGISCTEHKERQHPSMLSCTWGPFILFLSRCLKTTGAPKRARFPSNMLVPSSRVPQRSHPIGDTQAAHVVFISIVSLLFGFPHFRQAREGVMELHLQHLASNSFLSSKSDILRLLYSSSPLLSLSLCSTSPQAAALSPSPPSPSLSPTGAEMQQSLIWLVLPAGSVFLLLGTYLGAVPTLWYGHFSFSPVSGARYTRSDPPPDHRGCRQFYVLQQSPEHGKICVCLPPSSDSTDNDTTKPTAI